MKLYVEVVLCLLALGIPGSLCQTCCDEIGCVSEDAPYDALPAPDCPTSVTYKMYTRTNPTGEDLTSSTVPYSYNGARRTVIIAHAVGESSTWKYISDMRDALLAKEDVNVMVIDWSAHSTTLFPKKGISNARAVGMLTVKVIQNLLRQPFGDSRRFWCVGFGTAAHLCGYVGMSMPAGQKLGRVTGISPNKELDDIPDVRIGLNPSAALFVDVLHSDSSYLYGTKRRLGHQDSYYTGHENNIINLSLKNLLNLDLGLLICGPYCQYRFAIAFFTSSVSHESQCFATSLHCTSEQDLAGTCSSNLGCWAYGGYYADRSCRTTGIVHLKISSKDPYCVV